MVVNDVRSTARNRDSSLAEEAKEEQVGSS